MLVMGGREQKQKHKGEQQPEQRTKGEQPPELPRAGPPLPLKILEIYEFGGEVFQGTAL